MASSSFLHSNKLAKYRKVVKAKSALRHVCERLAICGEVLEDKSKHTSAAWNLIPPEKSISNPALARICVFRTPPREDGRACRRAIPASTRKRIRSSIRAPPQASDAAARARATTLESTVPRRIVRGAFAQSAIPRDPHRAGPATRPQAGRPHRAWGPTNVFGYGRDVRILGQSRRMQASP